MAKQGNEKADSIACAAQKVGHEKPIPNVYREIDTDLARDNLENDLPYADLQDL